MGETLGAQDRLADSGRSGASAAEVVLSKIAQRIASGEWTAESFPTVVQMRKQLGCRHGTLTQALLLGQERGVVHKVAILHPAPVGRIWEWRPASVSGEPPLVEVLAEKIRSGVLTGPLPTIPEMARECRVHHGTMQEAYEALAVQGLVRRVWLPDFTDLVWYAIDGREPEWLPPGEGTKADAIVADLRRRLPEWQSAGRVRALPPVEHLRKHYRTSWGCIVEVLTRLLAEGVLVQVPVPGRATSVYLPGPKADDPGSGDGSFALVDSEER
jgi:DNA-binding transcriptional regulator YhcF (GntR family)